MYSASDLAGWWEKQKAISVEATRTSLENWVQEHPSMFSVIVATAAQTLVEFPMALGAGFVDVLNLGKGTAEGGWGYAEDGLRLLTVAAPLARGGRTLLSRVVALQDAQLPNCTWMSAVKALRETGTRHFATLKDLMGAAKVSSTGGAWVDELVAPLRQIGARIRMLQNPTMMDDVIQAAKANRDGVVMFSVRFSNGSGHTLLASRHPLQGVFIADRSGKIVRGLAELEQLYPGISQAIPYGTMAVADAARVIKALDAVSIASMLALEVVSVLNPQSDSKKSTGPKTPTKSEVGKYNTRR